ncbi:hypothetical protein K1719_015521 [Acacia pycnantha]|nr:hypothetical protein K1719_015521 [Acacia pycnantha]
MAALIVFQIIRYQTANRPSLTWIVFLTLSLLVFNTRPDLVVIDELLLYWNLTDTDRVLDELEEALLVSDFGPKSTFKIVDNLREDILSGKLKSGNEIKEALKKNVLDLLTRKGSKTDLQLGFRKPAVIMVVGVNGGGKTTSLGKLAYRLKNEGAKVEICYLSFAVAFVLFSELKLVDQHGEPITEASTVTISLNLLDFLLP